MVIKLRKYKNLCSAKISDESSSRPFNPLLPSLNTLIDMLREAAKKGWATKKWGRGLRAGH